MANPSDLRLTLFMYDGCYYCDVVRAAFRELNVEVAMRDILREPVARRELAAARGRTRVPVLKIVEEGRETWMPESADIVEWLRHRFGDGPAPRPRVVPDAWVRIAMWGLLLGGGLAAEPLRSWIWAGACTVAGLRSLRIARRTGAWFHWAIAATFAIGAVSILLAGLGIASFAWWWVAFALVAVLLAGSLLRRRRA